MKARRGFFRLWITVSAIWLLAAGYALWPLPIPLERLPPDVSFCRAEPRTGLEVPIATCEQKYTQLVLEEWEHLAMQVSKIILPPFALLLFSFVGFWVARGFQ